MSAKIRRVDRFIEKFRSALRRVGSVSEFTKYTSLACIITAWVQTPAAADGRASGNLEKGCNAEIFLPNNIRWVR